MADSAMFAVYPGVSCVLCGDDLTNDLERDTGTCDPCAEVSV